MYQCIKRKLGTVTCKISYFCDEFDESKNYAGAIIYSIDGEYEWKNKEGGKANGFKGRSFYLIIQCTNDWPESYLKEAGKGRVHDYLLKNVLGIDYNQKRIACGGFAYVNGELKFSSIWLNRINQTGAESDGDKMLSEPEKDLISIFLSRIVQLNSSKQTPNRCSMPINQDTDQLPVDETRSHDPCATSTSVSHGHPKSSRTDSENDVIRIVCISDTHNGHSKQEFDDKIRKLQGDILIHAGDFGERGTVKERKDFRRWLESLTNFQYKIYIAGNMDAIGLDVKYEGAQRQKHPELVSRDSTVMYLENESCEVLGIKIYGCPYTPEFYGGFQYARRSEEAMALWKNIPKDCNLLISHGPPANILDQNSKGIAL
ncbi:unnamed protein product [Adineta steineri]|uniref:Calcineurin-like phosphoesterase domain-containing protein n=1 Tax=Adineta steineri TaxID=433720 RepID=A0A819T4A7_9BILA|nr:unnamed protein product [Adineta steineri]CAF1290045.1 unnamed protein product [Adineta steineri]CAF1431312.1 unnamed protein product [Adineta steineri]CAF3900387.1 unnamed protein product [Adineta steineri]CAF4060444.1 unnamed protein product [Adineta steineri]